MIEINKRVIQRTTDPDVACSKIVNILDNFDEVRSDRMGKASELIKNMEDPLDIILENLEVNN